MANKFGVTRFSQNGLRKWKAHCRQIYGKPVAQFAQEQWDLYWDGVRDVRLSDAAVYLIDKYGYR